ncbi:MAG: alpha/beta fold hydrolase [Pirellulales bacterium]|nr:alpha/beta fold hydrolase [Pirellulales bacterium]
MTDTDWRSLYPFQSHKIDLGGHAYHYLDEGTGPAVLLVHGNPTWSFFWRNVILALRDRFRMIAVDHMGCGLSDKPQEYPYSLATHVKNLRSLVEMLDLQDTTLFGHDWGGAIGLGVAGEAPQRFPRIVLANTAGFRSKLIPPTIRFCRTPLIGKWLVRRRNAFARAALKYATVRPQDLSPAVKAGYLAPYDSYANRVAVMRFVQDIPLSPQHPSYETLLRIEQSLPALTDRPWKFIWGMQDFCFTGVFLDRFLEFAPHAEVCRLEDAGHYVTEDACEDVIAAFAKFMTAHVDSSLPASAARS